MSLVVDCSIPPLKEKCFDIIYLGIEGLLLISAISCWLGYVFEKSIQWLCEHGSEIFCSVDSCG